MFYPNGYQWVWSLTYLSVVRGGGSFARAESFANETAKRYRERIENERRKEKPELPSGKKRR